MVISGLQRSAIQSLPYKFLLMAVYKAVDGMPIKEALSIAYDEWESQEEEAEFNKAFP